MHTFNSFHGSHQVGIFFLFSDRCLRPAFGFRGIRSISLRPITCGIWLITIKSLQTRALLILMLFIISRPIWICRKQELSKEYGSKAHWESKQHHGICK